MREEKATPIWESLFQAKEEQGGQLVRMESVRGVTETGSRKGWVAGRDIK